MSLNQQQKVQKNKKSLINFRVSRDNFMVQNNEGNAGGVVASGGFPNQQMSQMSIHNNQSGIIASSTNQGQNVHSSQNFQTQKNRNNFVNKSGNGSGSAAQNQMQQSHPNLVTFNQIDGYNTQGSAQGNSSGKRNQLQNSGRIVGTLGANQSNPGYQAMNDGSSRFKNINDRIKKTNLTNANRRIHISFDNANEDGSQGPPGTGQHPQIATQNQQMINISNQNTGSAANRITSTERHQNNNVSSANPKKAIVTPRQNHHLKAFKQNGAPDMINAIQGGGPEQNNIYQKNLSHQINTQRNNYNPQMIYGGGATSQFSVKHSANTGTNNLPLIPRTESHDSKLKERDQQQRFGALAQNNHHPLNMGNSQNLRNSHNFKMSASQGANQVQPSGNSTQNLRNLNFNKYGNQGKDTQEKMGPINHVNSAMLIQQNSQTSSHQAMPPTNNQQNQKMLFVKKNNKNQMHIFNKNKQQMAQISGMGAGVQSQQNNYVKPGQNLQTGSGLDLSNTKGPSYRNSQTDNTSRKAEPVPPKTQSSSRRNHQLSNSNQKQQGANPDQKNYNSHQPEHQDQNQFLGPNQRQLVQRINSVIPEASERDELTVNEAQNQTIDYPVDSAFCKQKRISEKYLTDFEKTEVEEYDHIYYLSDNEAKIKATKLERLVNNGFDDEEGYYRVKKNDHIAYRFQLIEVIGKGAFGQVIKCLDHKHKELVAIKLVKNQKKYYYQAAVEAKLLLLLKESDPDNVERVVKLRDYFVFRNHLCCVFDLYSINLYEFIKMYNYQGFEYGLIRRFAIQLLSALRYMKYLGIIHCDLKPENILLKRKDKSGIVVADFGSGCLENEIVYTYIQSRFYRAPDIILGLFPYTQQIDMWSFGCIMIELYTGFPLFPGTNEREQLQLIIDVIGMPSQQVLKNSQRKQLFSQFKDNAVPAPLEVLTNEQKEERLKYIMNKLREMPDPSFVNFIGRCLEWDPKKRLSPDEGLQHEWIIKGLPPNIILHNPHNNPYSRGNHNSSSSTQQYTNAQKTNSSSQSKSHSMKRQQSARRSNQNTGQNNVNYQSTGNMKGQNRNQYGQDQQQLTNQSDMKQEGDAMGTNSRQSRQSRQSTNGMTNNNQAVSSSQRSQRGKASQQSSGHLNSTQKVNQQAANQLDSRSIDRKSRVTKGAAVQGANGSQQQQQSMMQLSSSNIMNQSLNNSQQFQNPDIQQQQQMMNSTGGSNISAGMSNSSRTQRYPSGQRGGGHSDQPKGMPQNQQQSQSHRLGQNQISKRNNMVLTSNFEQ